MSVTAHLNRVRRERVMLTGFRPQPTDHQKQHISLDDLLKKKYKECKEH